MRKFCFFIMVLVNGFGVFAQAEVCTEEAYLNEDLNNIDKCTIDRYTVKKYAEDELVFKDSGLKIKYKKDRDIDLLKAEHKKVSKELINVFLESKREDLLKESN